MYWYMYDLTGTCQGCRLSVFVCVIFTVHTFKRLCEAVYIFILVCLDVCCVYYFHCDVLFLCGLPHFMPSEGSQVFSSMFLYKASISVCFSLLFFTWGISVVHHNSDLSLVAQCNYFAFTCNLSVSRLNFKCLFLTRPVSPVVAS